MCGAPVFFVLHFFLGDFSKRANLHPESNLIVKLRLLSGSGVFHWRAPAGRGEILSMLACPDGGPRVCGEVDANKDAGGPEKS